VDRDVFIQVLFHLSNELGILKILLLTLAAGHWLGCIWYFCGATSTDDVDRNGAPLHGWVIKHYGE
jgi:hypothetical protein